MNSTHAPDRADALCRPALALGSRQSHPIQGRCDVLIRPAARHTLDDGQGIIGRDTFMFTGLWFAQAEGGMSTALPMDRQHDLAVSLINVDGNVVYKRAHQLLARSHRHAGR